MNDERPLLILGASARAAAQSALRAGFCPIAGDLFADADLVRCCPAHRCQSYPAGLLDIAAAAPQGPWMYTGALENHPDLVDEISRQRPLYGNPGSVLRRVRDPSLLAAALQSAGLPCPKYSPISQSPPRDGSYLRKRLKSAGGTHVQVWDQSQPPSDNDGHYYFQQRIDGVACSAVYLGRGDPRDSCQSTAELLGLSELLTGQPWLHGGVFQYCGSLAPLELPPATWQQATAIGLELARTFALRGLYGVDMILDAQNVLWPVEVNPRYTASVEVLERALSFSAIQLHVDCFSSLDDFAASAAPPTHQALSGQSASRARCHGKAILFASQPITVSADLAAAMLAAAGEPARALADVPCAGTEIPAGAPVCSIFASGKSPQDTLSQLQAQSRHWERRCVETW